MKHITHNFFIYFPGLSDGIVKTDTVLTKETARNLMILRGKEGWRKPRRLKKR